MPALNNIDLEALREAHMDSNDQKLENVSVATKLYVAKWL